MGFSTTKTIMGNCFAAQSNKDTDMKLKNSKENTFQIESKFNGDHDSMKLQSQSQELGSKEEMFFDSQPWIDSDVEDFHSVNGDSTSLDGTNPLEDSSFVENPQPEELAAETSSTDMKKQLIELFRESFSNDSADHDPTLQEKSEPFLPPSNCKNTNACESVKNSSISSAKPVPNVQSNSAKPKSGQSANCCLPNLMRSLSSPVEKKKKLSTAYRS